jgi:hypothetical protein
MKFGVREICEVVFRAKARQQIGNKIFYKNEPVIYFDTLKTSSLEGAATTVYAQGGRGNARLVAWEGERTVTFTMEDALISPEGFMILSGAGLIEASEGKPIYQHMTETIDQSDVEVVVSGTDARATIKLSEKPYMPKDKGDNFAYVMFMRDGEIVTEPYIPIHFSAEEMANLQPDEDGKYSIVVEKHDCYNDSHITENTEYIVGQLGEIKFDSVLVDFYVAREAAAKQIEITADKFGGNFYVEAQTLFRDTNGVDMPAEFIIPNAKIQSNFTFTMASSGDPSSFTFTMDAFPDYTRFDHSKKVLAAIQIIEEETAIDLHRGATPNGDYRVDGNIEGIETHELNPDIWNAEG